MSRAIPPWHLWGVDQSVQIALTTPNFTSSTSQLVKATFKRPTTWSFLVWCNVTFVTTAGGNDTVECDFDLMVGVGRSVVTIPKWISLQATVGNAGSTFLWADVAPVVGLAGFGGGATPQIPFSSTFVAEDVQIQAHVSLGGNVGDTLAANVGAFVAPIDHIRPDWFPEASEHEKDGH